MSSSSSSISIDHLASSSESPVLESNMNSAGRRKCGPKEDRHCLVCGDKALGFNFNVITCESCKAFFRRNAFKEKTVKCLFDNNCLIDTRTRRFCPACRIKKCYKAGMNPQMILDDREKKKRVAKVSENRIKKKSVPNSDSVMAESRQPNDINASSVNLNQEDSSYLVDYLANIKKEQPSDTNSAYDDNKAIELTPKEERPKTPVGKAHGEERDAIFKHPNIDEIPQESNMYYKLLPDEKAKLDKLCEAYGDTLGAMPNIGPYSNQGHYRKAADLINFSEIAVRKLIDFVKHLDSFQLISQSDQVSLLKSCVMHTLLLRSALFYNIEKDAWITPNMEISSSILKETTGFAELYHCHVYYCRRVKSMAGCDLVWYALLQILLIFDPAVPDVTNRRFLSDIQDQNLLLLKRYLESKYSYKFSRQYYVSSLDRLCDMKALSDEHTKIFLQVSAYDVKPLMLEVLNLK